MIMSCGVSPHSSSKRAALNGGKDANGFDSLTPYLNCQIPNDSSGKEVLSYLES